MTTTNTTETTTVVYASKRDHAAALYKAQLTDVNDVKSCMMRRKDGIAMFVEKCGMTTAGAGTYWANFHAGIWSLEGAKTKQAGAYTPATTTTATQSVIQSQTELMANLVEQEVERRVAARMAELTQQAQVSKEEGPRIILPYNMK